MGQFQVQMWWPHWWRMWPSHSVSQYDVFGGVEVFEHVFTFGPVQVKWLSEE